MLLILSSPAYAKIDDSRPGTQIYLSPLQTLTNCYEKVFKEPISIIEQITPFAATPWWIAPPITIHHNKKETERAHTHLVNELPRKKHCLLFYTDGSGINGKIGAVEVGPTITRNAFLGPSDSFTVHSGELYGISFATEMSLEAHTEPQVVIICVDSQAAIRAAGSPKNKSGQHIMRQIVQAIDRLRQSGSTVEIHLVPVHIAFCGNEAADKLAKEATRWRLKKLRRGGVRDEDTLSMATKALRVRELLSAKKTQLTKHAMTEWGKEWTKERRGRELQRLEAAPRKRTVTFHIGLSKELSSLVVQMRTGKIRLREFLFHRKVPGIEDGRCECRQGNQTVKHILLEFRLLACQRHNLWIDEAKRTRKEGGRSLDIERILTDGPCVKKAAMFIKKTGLTGRSMAPLTEGNQCNTCIGTGKNEQLII